MTDMTELERLLSATSVECWEKDVTANVQSWDADANHSLLQAHNHTATHTTTWLLCQQYAIPCYNLNNQISTSSSEDHLKDAANLLAITSSYFCTKVSF